MGVRNQSLVWKMDHEAVIPAPNAKNDAGLVARARAGDETAWSAIVELHWKQVWSLSRMVVRDDPGAEEVTQETFRAVRDRLAGFETHRSLCGWIQAIGRQRALEELRRRSRQPAPAGASAPGAGHPDVELALTRLEPEEREALLLSVAGSEPEELAQALGIDAATVRARTASARARLLEQLDAGGIG